MTFNIYHNVNSPEFVITQAPNVTFDINHLVFAPNGVPSGGTTSQVLAKKSDTNYDTEWVDQTGGVGGEMTAQQIADKLDTFTVSTPTDEDYIILGGKKKTLISALPTFLSGGGLTYKGRWSVFNNIITSDDAEYDGFPLPEANATNLGIYFIASDSYDYNTTFFWQDDWIISYGTLGWEKHSSPNDAIKAINGIGSAGYSIPLTADNIPDATTTNKFTNTTEKDTWNAKSTAPNDAEKNIIIGVQKNGVDLTVDLNRKVNVVVPTQASEVGASPLGHDHSAEIIQPDSIICPKVYTVAEITALPAKALFFDEVNQCYAYKLADGGVIQNNQEPYDLYINLQGNDIVEMDVVSICGASGNRTGVCLTDATNDNKSQDCIGIVTVATIGNNQVGRITKSGGKVRGLNTNVSGWAEGDTLYLDASNAGKLTNVAPAAPNNKVKVGILSVKHAVNGIIELSIHVESKLSNLTDVDGSDTTIASGSSFLFKITSGIWQHITESNFISWLKTKLDGYYATALALLLKRDKTEIGDAHGFVSPPNSSNFTISNVGSSITVNLLSNAGNYKINGADYVNSGLTLTFTASLGQNLINVNSSGLINSAFDILDLTKIPCCTINWDGTTAILADELHSANRNLIEHKKQHDTDGCRWVSGGVTTFASGATNTFSHLESVVRDEDRYHTLVGTKTQGMITYRNSALSAMITDAASTRFCKLVGTTTGAPYYDNAGVLTALGTSQYGIYWMYNTNRKLPVNSEIVFVMGQGAYTSVANAQAAPQPTLSGMTVAEWKLMYRVIVRNVAGALAFTQADDLRLTATALAVSGSGITSLPASQITENNFGNAQLAIDALKIPQADDVTSSGTIEIAPNTVKILTTTFTNVHTFVLTPTAPSTFTYLNECTVRVLVGSTTPALSITPPTGVTFTWMDKAAPTTLTINKTYTFVFFWINSTMCQVYHAIKA